MKRRNAKQATAPVLASPAAAPAPSPDALPEAVAPPASTRPWHWVLLALILIAAVGLRAYNIGGEGFWIDELFSLEASAGHNYGEARIPRDQIIEPPAPKLTTLEDALPVHRLWDSFYEDQHPPLYFVVLRLWREAFGSSDVSCRALSLVWSVIAIAVMFDLARVLFGPTVALWACAIMAVAQQQILFAQETRSYMMLTALTLAAAAAVARIERMGFTRRRGAALALALLAAMLTHYNALAGCAAVGLYAVLRLRGRDRTYAVSAMVAAAAAFAVVWLPYAVDQLDGLALQSTWLADHEPGSRVARWLTRVLNTPASLMAELSNEPSAAPYGFFLLLLLPLVRLRRLPRLLLPLLIAAFCIALPATLDLLRGTRQLEFIRFSLGAAPGLYLVGAALLADRRDWLRHAIPAALVIYGVAHLKSTYATPKAEWRDLGRQVARDGRPGDMILYLTPDVGDWYATVIYLAVERYAPHIPGPQVILTKDPTPEMLARARDVGRLWLACDGTQIDFPSVAPGFRLMSSSFYWGVGMLYRLEPDPSAVPVPARR